MIMTFSQRLIYCHMSCTNLEISLRHLRLWLQLLNKNLLQLNVDQRRKIKVNIVKNKGKKGKLSMKLVYLRIQILQLLQA